MDDASVYNANIKYPIPESGLETSRVKLTPFLPLTHGKYFDAQVAAHPELARWMPIPLTPASIESMVADPDSILFAVIDKTKGEQGSFAGVIGMFLALQRYISILRNSFLARSVSLFIPEPVDGDWARNLFPRVPKDVCHIQCDRDLDEVQPELTERWGNGISAAAVDRQSAQYWKRSSGGENGAEGGRDAALDVGFAGRQRRQGSWRGPR